MATALDERPVSSPSTRGSYLPPRERVAIERMDREDAWKAAEQQMRAQQAAQRAAQDEGRAQRAELEMARRTAMDELKALKDEIKAADTERAVQDTTGFIKATRDLTGTEDDYQQRLIDAAVAFPNANHKDEFIQNRYLYLNKQNEAHMGRKEREKAIKAGGLTVTSVTDKDAGITMTRGDKPEPATVTETKETIDPATDEVTRKTVTQKVPAEKLKATTPPTGKEFLDSLGIKPKPRPIKSVDGAIEG